MLTMTKLVGLVSPNLGLKKQLLDCISGLGVLFRTMNATYQIPSNYTVDSSIGRSILLDLDKK